MALGFETGIRSFYARKQGFFETTSIDDSFQKRMQALKNKINEETELKPTVVILGAGPAGLLRAIQSISNGNPTTLIERRTENASKRSNMVALTNTTISMLRYCGIYQYLVEKKLIYPDSGKGYIMVSLGDLEMAMNKVLSEIKPDFAIQYHSKVTEIDSQSEKINLVVENITTHEKRTIKKIDILVNTEGKSSSTNSLLGIERTTVLPSIPVIAAIFEDKRPKIRGVISLLKYVGRSVIYLAQTIHYYIQFRFRIIFSLKFRKEIMGALILKTPKHNYVGCGFSDKINARLESLKEAVNAQEIISEETKRTGSDKEKKQQSKKLARIEKKYKAHANRWIHLSISHANMAAKIRNSSRETYSYTAPHLSLTKFEIIKIGADHANQYCKSVNQSSVLLGGDASATVDPTTGLGCNTAILSSVDFLDFIWDYDTGSKPEKLLEEYSARIKERVAYIHKASKEARRLYRPDALIPTQ